MEQGRRKRLERISRLKMLVGMVELVAQRGTCSRAQVGALIIRDNRIVSMGYNGTPAGMDHCSHYEGEDINNSCEETVHAEVNAISFAARNGISTEGATLICTHAPCVKCSQMIINTGIINVYYINKYRSQAGLKLLTEAGLSVVNVPGSDNYEEEA